MKQKLIIMLVFALLVTAVVGCVPIAIHGGHDDTHGNSNGTHGSSDSAHGTQSSDDARGTHRGGDAHGSQGSDDAHGSQGSDDTQRSSEGGEGLFPTVGFEERVDVTISFVSTEVCPLFEPAGRFLIYDWWNPTILREAEGETLEGLIMAARGFDLDILLVVTEHAPSDGRLQYIVLWGDFELQRIDITCIEGETAGSTQVIWNERNAGLHENGVSMVTSFVEGGNIQSIVEKYAQNATQYLQDN